MVLNILQSINNSLSINNSPIQNKAKKFRLYLSQ